MKLEAGFDIYTLVEKREITNNSICQSKQYSIAYNGKESENIYICIYV